jgi:hypothetical protein
LSSPMRPGMSATSTISRSRMRRRSNFFLPPAWRGR